MNNTNIELPDDNRGLFESESRYKSLRAKKYQKREAIYLGIILFINMGLILLNYLDIAYRLLSYLNSDINYMICKKLIYCILFGLLGGITFDIKYFYRAVARGQWHEDRIFWRIFTPWVSIPLSLVMAAIMNKTVIESNIAIAICIGFFSGYFSDDAIGKMSDVAQVIFSRTYYTIQNEKEEHDSNISEK